ncbi:hypothetical protein MesoLj131a_56760 [Mesorhizobium sp. 131-2-1]|nr:hypothetical protein MesoLj131a_56760 [Mesorhizobium sp. 131-2-1]
MNCGRPEPASARLRMEPAVTDDKTKRDFRDRERVAGDEEYEVGYLASKFGLTIPEVRELIKKHGNNREVLEREAERLGVKLNG